MTETPAPRFLLINESWDFVLDPTRSELGYRMSAAEYGEVRAWLIHEMGVCGRWEIGSHGVTIPDLDDALVFRLRWC